VTAVNKVDEGVKSAEQTTGFLSACTPAKPTGLKEKTTGLETGSAVSVVWTAGAANGSAVSTYNIHYMPVGSTTAVKANTTAVTTAAYTLDASKLTNGKLKFYVTATNIKGTSAASDTVEIYSANKPSAPTALVAKLSEGKDKITLSWTAAASNGAEITGHSFKQVTGIAAA